MSIRTDSVLSIGWVIHWRGSSSPHSPKISQTARITRSGENFSLCMPTRSLSFSDITQTVHLSWESCSVLWFCFVFLGYAWSRQLIAAPLPECVAWLLSRTAHTVVASQCKQLCFTLQSLLMSHCHVSRCYHLLFHFHNQFTSPVQPGPASRPVTAGEGPRPWPLKVKNRKLNVYQLFF